MEMKRIKILFTSIFLIIILLIILNLYEIQGNLFSYAGSVNTLIVESSSIRGIAISADNSTYSGITDYIKQSSEIIPNTWLTAPTTTTSGDHVFSCWKGCDKVDDNKCSVYVNNGLTQEVTAYYISTTPPPPPPPPSSEFDLSVTSLDIRSFICKNKEQDKDNTSTNYKSFLSKFLEENPDYRHVPSTTYATQYYNEVASSTCPESQRNRPVEFSATARCEQGNGSCPSAKLQIKIVPKDPENYGIPLPHDSTNPKYETKIFETAYNANYPKSIQGEYTFANAYDYKVTACVVDQNNNEISDEDNSNNCKEQILRIFYYLCYLGFPLQAQTNWINLPFRVLQTLETDSPTIYWLNEICIGQIIH
jgi:hypothetical protein